MAIQKYVLFYFPTRTFKRETSLNCETAKFGIVLVRTSTETTSKGEIFVNIDFSRQIGFPRTLFVKGPHPPSLLMISHAVVGVSRVELVYAVQYMRSMFGCCGVLTSPGIYYSGDWPKVHVSMHRVPFSLSPTSLTPSLPPPQKPFTAHLNEKANKAI